MLESIKLEARGAFPTVAHAELQGGVQPSISVKRRQSILFVTSEIADYIKAGGLGEVSAALPRALRHHYDVRILIPGYRQVLSQIGPVEEIARLPASYGIPACGLGRGTTQDGLTVYVLLCPELYDRDGSPYVDSFGVDWSDNDIRFARLGLAAADIACGNGDHLWRADLLHLNDWPSGLASAYLAWRGQHIPTILTIHNLAYQGNFDRSRLSHLGIPDAAFQINGVEFYGKLSFLKAGIYYSSHITTVSSTYAQEITRPEFGCGLDGLLRTCAEQGRLDGIINGIDESWDPSKDPYLVSPFSAENCRGKRANANNVRENFGLALSSGPLFAVVSRLVHQKGVDLAISAAETIVSQGGQIAVIGQGEPRFEAELQALAGRHPGSVGVKIGYDEGDARRMYAGSDFLLMPSRFEPCGLSQMYAQRFGSLPIAHKTGGLADTIEDGVNGFLFGEPSLNRFKDAIKRGLEAFRSRPRLTAMRKAAMQRPHGWDRSASRYQEVYERARQTALA
ncbi:glycogen synthase GlgA [Microvirga sp. CF3016]|uniref:glycogen synthase GlgA n=1 Tax=Microvirga sp. CF3016 TaxID=3110181 RepID=UPI002E7A64D7|nr:glycogen synthase GlgA [Microvirga sp. CF3016]MEE1613576.1 glycogen synthase GlgA [Microvirga sp. CF3016]